MEDLSLFCVCRDPLESSPGLTDFLLMKRGAGTDPQLLGPLTLFSFAGWVRDGVHFVLSLLYPQGRLCPSGGPLSTLQAWD